MSYALIRAKRKNQAPEYFPADTNDLLTILGELEDYKDVRVIATGTWRKMSELQRLIEIEGEYVWVEYPKSGMRAVLSVRSTNPSTLAFVRVLAYGSSSLILRQTAKFQRIKQQREGMAA